MVELVEDVLPYLLVFYLVESLVLVRPSEWALLIPWRSFRLERSGLHLAGVSPLAETIGLFVPPLLLSADGAVLVDPAVTPPESRLLAFEAMGPVAVDGRAVRIGDRRVATPAPAAARRLAAALRALRDGPAAERPARLREVLAGKADLDEARARRTVQVGCGRLLRGLGLALFLATFALLPASVAIEGPGPGPVLLLVLALLLAIAGVSWTMLRRCGRSRAEAASAVAPMLLFPPSAIHASGHLARDLYLDLDPMAAAAAVLPGEAFLAVARRLVHHLDALRGAGEGAAAGAEAQLASWRDVLKAAGASLDDVVAAPASPDPSAALYCPLCGGEYRAGFSTCSDCGVPLRALAGLDRPLSLPT